MLPPTSSLMRIIHLLRDNSLNILAFITVLFLVISPFVSLFLTVFILYFILSQFKELPIYKPLRKWGYDAWFLQYYNPTILDTDTGRELFDNRDIYRGDYVSMGYKEFYMYADELTRLNQRYRQINLSVDAYENSYN